VKEEVEEWKQRCPLATFETNLRARNEITDAGFATLEAAVIAEINEAVTFAEAGAWEPIADLPKDVYTYSDFDLEVRAKSTTGGTAGTGNTGEIRPTPVSPWFICLNTQIGTAVKGGRGPMFWYRVLVVWLKGSQPKLEHNFALENEG
jgi:hypothetical protein